MAVGINIQGNISTSMAPAWSACLVKHLPFNGQVGLDNWLGGLPLQISSIIFTFLIGKHGKLQNDVLPKRIPNKLLQGII